MPADGDVVAVTRTENATFGKGLVKPEAADISATKQSVNEAGDATHEQLSSPTGFWLKPLAYGFLNIAAATSIVFANKAVSSFYGFNFTVALTLCHTLTTIAGLALFCQFGMFSRKEVSRLQVLPLSAAYVGYIVLNNVSLRINTVGLYQISKICIMPVLIAMEMAFFGKFPSKKVLAAVALVCIGVALATVTDGAYQTSLTGLVVGLAAILVTAIYQIWAGSKQKELQAGSMQLLHQSTPIAAVMLAVLVPMLEPIGLFSNVSEKQTLIGFEYSLPSVTAIAVSSILGLVVSLSTFLVIGATSSLTFNIVGHLKTVIILAGGCLIFGESMTPATFAGVAIALAGIAWYTHVQLSATVQQPKGKT